MVTNGMWTHYLTCEDYQDLIDRGWRRSGKYCYKPVMNTTCCPLYTIRCEATKFRLSKSQKTVLKRMNDFLLYGKKEKQQKSDAPPTASSGKPTVSPKSVRPGVGPDPSKPPCRKAKLVRRERKQQKLARNTGGSNKMEADPTDQCSATQLSSDPTSKATKGEDTDISPPTRKGDAADTPSTSKGNTTDAPLARTDKSTDAPSSVSKAAKSKSTRMDVPPFLQIGPDGKKPLEMFLTLPASDRAPTHKLELKLIRSSPPSPEFQATFKESYMVYKKYQMAIHHDTEDECTEKQFRRFLCDSPLIPRKGPVGWPCDYGSYHHHYYIDGKLFMVGVIDILPKCVSSVYLYYDTDYGFLTPGVYSALRETEMTRQLYLQNPTLEYYYMGYYVHNCQKMRYKGQYFPSFLLCPESYRFIPIEICIPKLDASKYSRLNNEATEPENVDSWLDSTLVLFQRQAMPYAVFKMLCGTRQNPKVREYAGFVGREVASRMLLFLTADAD